MNEIFLETHKSNAHTQNDEQISYPFCWTWSLGLGQDGLRWQRTTEQIIRKKLKTGKQGIIAQNELWERRHLPNPKLASCRCKEPIAPNYPMIYICFGFTITFASCFRISKAHGWGTHSWNVTTSSSYTPLFWEWPTLVHYLHFTKLACPPNSLESRQWDTSSPADSIVYGKWSMVFFKGVRWLLKHYTVKDPQP
jgi:hypothetical protein